MDKVFAENPTSSLDAMWLAYRRSRTSAVENATSDSTGLAYLPTYSSYCVTTYSGNSEAGVGHGYLNARYYEGSRGQFLSQDPVFWEVGQTQDGRAALSDPQSMNSYAYAGGNPITNKDPNGRWYKEFITGQQSWSSFYGEVGEAANYMGQNNAGWDFAMDHPYTTGAAVGVGAGLTAYGTVAIAGQAATGIRLASLDQMPMLSRVTSIPNKGFDAIQKATGLSQQGAINLVQSTGRSLVDVRPGNVGNINTLSNIGDKAIRITTNPSATKIISTGVTSASKISGYQSAGQMQAPSIITSIAKSVTQIIKGLFK